MHPRRQPPPELLSLAGCQGGVVTREQTRAFGVSDRVIARLVADRLWRRVTSGVYLVRDLDPDWAARTWSGVLLGGPAARLGGDAAAFEWQLTPVAPDQIAVWVPHDRVLTRRDGWEFRRERFGIRDRRSYGAPPRLSAADTVLDLCDELEPDAAVGLLLSAVQSGRVTPRRLAAAIDGRTQVRHRKLLRDMVLAAGVGAESPLEVRFLHDVERAHGLPRGRRQARASWAPFVRDVRYDAYAVVVELDGRLGHDGMGRFRDMDRDNLAVLAGEVVLRYGWPDVTGRACRVGAQLAQVLSARGWTGVPQRCSRCRAMPEADWWV